MVTVIELVQAGIVDDEVEALDMFPIEMFAEFGGPDLGSTGCLGEE